jgi:DNA-binding transcriptional ArsR family regulator
MRWPSLQMVRRLASPLVPSRRASSPQEGELKVTALAEPFDMSLPAVSKHLRVLQRAGLLVQEKEGRTRRCQLAAEPLQAAAAWIEQYRAFWQGQFDALASYLGQIEQESGERHED